MPVIEGAALRALLPHAGAMCLLDEVFAWSDKTIACRTTSHLLPNNPLRRQDRLATICGAEYGLQAAALHGALLAGGERQPTGYLSGLNLSRIEAERLDDPALGALLVTARIELADRRGLIYGFDLRDQNGRLLLEGRGTILFPETIAAAGAEAGE
jgi:predicted hotdog family 3-hydroxylacyl-ACP dehydratase